MSGPQTHKRMCRGAGRDNKWVFWRWFHIGDYLHRLKIISTPYGAIYLHKMMTPDQHPVLHDHPWAFISFIVRGGYREVYLDKMTREVRKHRIWFVNVKHRDDAHYIYQLCRVPTWTLVFVGRRHRTWGFWRPIKGDDEHAIPQGKRGWSWHEFDQDVVHAKRLKA